MNLLLALAIVSFFLAIIGVGRYAEFTVRRKVARAVRRRRCPKCNQALTRARVRAAGEGRRRRVTASPNPVFPESWRVQCRRCGAILHCDSRSGSVRFL